jgi:hypothetical protein
MKLVFLEEQGARLNGFWAHGSLALARRKEYKAILHRWRAPASHVSKSRAEAGTV